MCLVPRLACCKQSTDRRGHKARSPTGTVMIVISTNRCRRTGTQEMESGTASSAAGEAPVSSISGVTLEKAEKELFEVPERRGEMIAKLREEINKWTPTPEDEYEQGLAFTRKDDKFLLRFLRTKKFDINRSLQLYVNYHKYRSKYSDLLGEMNPSTVGHLLRGGAVCVLPSREGPRIILIQTKYIDFENLIAGDILKTLLLVFDKILETDEAAQVHGIAVIEDLDGFSLFSAMKVAGQEAVRKGVMVELIQESFPARFKGIHLVNQAWYFSLVFTIVRPFLKQKLRERFQVYGEDFESLHESIAPEYLPKEYSGVLESVDEYTADKLFPELFTAPASTQDS